jgi:hypothetical protein
MPWVEYLTNGITRNLTGGMPTGNICYDSSGTTTRYVTMGPRKTSWERLMVEDECPACSVGVPYVRPVLEPWPDGVQLTRLTWWDKVKVVLH